MKRLRKPPIPKPMRHSIPLDAFSTTPSLLMTDDLQPTLLTTFVQQVVEKLVDGVLILTESGEVVYANSHAQMLCQTLSTEDSADTPVPPQIWRICEALIDSKLEFPEHQLILEDEIVTPQANIRVRARWLDLPGLERACITVTLEDRFQSIKNLAMAEAQKYNLTPREAEVWLLKRANHTYKAIASELHIAIDTVRKHVKSIYAKREAFQWINE